jgi:ABC-type maltose transport system permease subunit
MASTSSSLAGTRARARVGSAQVDPNRRLGQILRLVILIIGCLYALFPMVIIVSAALDPSNTVSSKDLFTRISLDNFTQLFNDPTRPFAKWLANSVYVSGVSTFITLVICTLAAYSLSRFRFRGRRFTMITVLVIQVFPNLLAIVALYLFLQNLGQVFPLKEASVKLLADPNFGSQFLGRLAQLFNIGLDSHGGLILIYCGGAIGFNTYLMKGYFDTVPRDLDESAMVDGASQFQTFIQIILPLVRPIIAVIAVLSFIGTFSDFLLAKILLKDTEVFTFAVGISIFIDNQYGKYWGLFAAAALIGAIPIAIMYLLVQRQITSGLTAGAVKG